MFGLAFPAGIGDIPHLGQRLRKFAVMTEMKKHDNADLHA
jgi:hypothetical protein